MAVRIKQILVLAVIVSQVSGPSYVSGQNSYAVEYGIEYHIWFENIGRKKYTNEGLLKDSVNSPSLSSSLSLSLSPCEQIRISL